MAKRNDDFIRWFEEIGIGDVPLVGGKTASLGEMYRTLKSHGVKVPNGFAVTASAYRHLIAAPGVSEKLHELLSGVDKRNVADFARRGAALRKLVYEAPISKELSDEIGRAYTKLEAEYGKGVDVAVRSSATLVWQNRRGKYTCPGLAAGIEFQRQFRLEGCQFQGLPDSIFHP